tara:strand:- start:3939 stop:4760 length:822 start_codon:yes stop_codon:yes gene_type:complete
MVIKDCDQKLLDAHPDLEFIGSYFCDTGELLNVRKARYRNLDFIIYDSGLLIVKGSLHKYKNQGIHNYDDFTYHDLLTVLDDISKRFGLPLNKCILRNCEVGVNIEPPLPTNIVLESLLTHKQTVFKDVSVKRGFYKQAFHHQYLVKVYDKSMQYGLKNACLRFELKFTRMEILNKNGVVTLDDLRSKERLQCIGNLLTNEWNNILLYEHSNLRNPTKRELKWKDPYYWQRLKKQHRYREKLRYKRYVHSFTGQNHLSLAMKIEKRYSCLINS